MSGADGGRTPVRAVRDEQEALAALRRATGPLWRTLLPMWLILFPLMTVMGVWFIGDGWRSSAIYGVLFASFFVPMWGWGEGRRRRKCEPGADATSLERGVITGTDQGWITVRGERHTVTWRPDSAVGLRPGDKIWAAPSITPGERIVLVRGRTSRGVLQDVIGPRRPAESAEEAERA